MAEKDSQRANGSLMKAQKPLQGKAYGSIPHLPGSRRGSGDYGLEEPQARTLTSRARDDKDVVVVQEKLDGSNVAVALLEGEIIPLIRAGYRAIQAPREMHHWFHDWVLGREEQFWLLLEEGERVVGEWLAVAHGTRYELKHDPFVAFDIIDGQDRRLSAEVKGRCEEAGLVTPHEIWRGEPLEIEAALALLDPSVHGALDPIEGAVWRVERGDKVDFLGKYVRSDKVDGKYLPETTGEPAIYNWQP